MSKKFGQYSVKYRPKTLDEIIGNDVAVSKAKSIINKKDTHAILLTGDSGCVDADTEYLTPTGWKKISGYKHGEVVAQFHKRTGKMTFTLPTDYINRSCKKMYHFNHEYGVDMVLCEEHNILYSSYKTKDHEYGSINKFKLTSCYNILQLTSSQRSKINIPVVITSRDSYTQLDISDVDLRLQIAIMADGHLNHSGVTVSLKKERKINRLKKLLIMAKRPWVEWTVDGFTRFRFKPPIYTKTFDARFWMCSIEQCKIITEECVKWDGDNKNKFFTRIKSSADFIQYAFFSIGKSSRILDNGRGDLAVHVVEREYVGLGSTNPKPFKPIDGRKYCFTVPSGFLVLRRNGSIFITGNCGKTTIAKVIANSLTKYPVDIDEKNIGDENGIDSIRALIKSSQYLPRGQFKTYILDECHALLGRSQSAILKAVEEPEHDRVIWILCTNKPHLLQTELLNRLYKIQVVKPELELLAKYLYKITKQEKILTKFDKKQVQRICLEIAKITERVPRESLQLLKEIADSATEYPNFKDLIVRGIRKSIESSDDKLAMQVIMCIYSPERDTEEKVKFLYSILYEQNVWGVMIRVVDIHYAILNHVAGIRIGAGYYYVKELIERKAVPDIKIGTQVAAKLVKIKNDLITINSSVQHHVVPELAKIIYFADDLQK